jgi:Esterase-like activity of phytase
MTRKPANKPTCTFWAFIFILFLSACKRIDFPYNHGGGKDDLPQMASQNSPEIIFTNANGYPIYNGGYGSAIVAVPGSGKNRLFYLMTDRGPNVDGCNGGKVFPVPAFNPHIGLFKLEGNELKKLGVIHFKDEDGNPLSGLPSETANLGGTGEMPYKVGCTILPYDPKGIDPEGLVAMQDGSFWVSDEYGPHIIHFNANGKTLERINPFGTGFGGRNIPLVFGLRRPNRGMEALTITPDGKWLVGMMQSPLDNFIAPATRSTARNSRVLRILFFNIATGQAKQYLYRTETADGLVSDITAISDNEFLVLERDGEFPLADNPSSSFKRIYRINVQGASEVSDASNSVNGLLINGKTLETAEGEPGFQALVPVSKTLALDIIAKFPNYPHDKPEGISLINKDILAISNDDDFGILDDGAGSYKSKMLPFFAPQQVVDYGVTYFTKLSYNKSDDN